MQNLRLCIDRHLPSMKKMIGPKIYVDVWEKIRVVGTIMSSLMMIIYTPKKVLGIFSSERICMGLEKNNIHIEKAAHFLPFAVGPFS